MADALLVSISRQQAVDALLPGKGKRAAGLDGSRADGSRDAIPPEPNHLVQHWKSREIHLIMAASTA